MYNINLLIFNTCVFLNIAPYTINLRVIYNAAPYLYWATYPALVYLIICSNKSQRLLSKRYHSAWSSAIGFLYINCSSSNSSSAFFTTTYPYYNSAFVSAIIPSSIQRQGFYCTQGSASVAAVRLIYLQLISQQHILAKAQLLIIAQPFLYSALALIICSRPSCITLFSLAQLQQKNSIKQMFSHRNTIRRHVA